MDIPEWYIYTEEGSQGPYSAQEIIDWRESGDITDDWFIWKEGMTDWQPLGNIPVLAPPGKPAETKKEFQTRKIKCPNCGQETEDEKSCFFCGGDLHPLPKTVESRPVSSRTSTEQSSGGFEKQKTLTATIIAGVIAVLASTAGKQCGRDLSGSFTGKKASKKMISSTTWKRYNLSGTKLSFSSPSPCKNTSIPVAANVRKQIVKMEACSFELSDFIFMGMYVKYVRGVKVDLEGAYHGGMGNVANRRDVKRLRHSASPYSVSGREALLVNGTLELSGKDSVLKAVIIGGGRRMWMLLTVANTKGNGPKLGDKFIDSIQFD